MKKIKEDYLWTRSEAKCRQRSRDYQVQEVGKLKYLKVKWPRSLLRGVGVQPDESDEIMKWQIRAEQNCWQNNGG